MPGRPKGLRRSQISKRERYRYITEKDPITGKLPIKNEKVDKEIEKKESEPVKKEEKKESKLDRVEKIFKD